MQSHWKRKTKQEIDERKSRQQRIDDERASINPNIRDSFKEIEKFRETIVDFKSSTNAMTKKYLADKEEASKADYVAMMAQLRQLQGEDAEEDD